jgi:hypothetical protein
MQITANVYWCKLEKLVDKYRPDQGKEWAIEAAKLSKETKLALKAAGVLARVKNKMDDRDDFLHFAISEYQRPRLVHADGKYDLWDFDKGSLEDAFDAGYTAKKNDSVPLFKADGKTLWDFKTDGLIGNDSVADFKFDVSAPNVYLVAVRIREHVKYEGAGGDKEDITSWDDAPAFMAESAVNYSTKTPKTKPKADFAKDFADAVLDDELPL